MALLVSWAPSRTSESVGRSITMASSRFQFSLPTLLTLTGILAFSLGFGVIIGVPATVTVVLIVALSFLAYLRIPRHRLRRVGVSLIVASVLVPLLLAAPYGWNGSVEFDELRLLAALFAVLAFSGLLIVAYTVSIELKLVAVAVLVAIIALGYASANHSIVECEDRTAQWLAVDISRNDPFWVLSDEHTDDACRIFERVNADSQVCPRPSIQFPWCRVKPGRTKLPFVVAVEYGWVVEPQVGQGGQKVYFCLFGYCIEISDAIAWGT